MENNQLSNNEIKESYFIKRPIFATVISILITLVGLICIQLLPIERFPSLVPPGVSITATYNGASADTIAKNVASILESQIFGVEDMVYVSSVSSNAGYVAITVTFKVGADPDLATINVSNRVQRALPRLPAEVQQLGISVTKRNPAILMMVSIYSPNESYSKTFLDNFVKLNVVDEVKLVQGVGEANSFGDNQYAMRLWLDPNKLAYYNLTPTDVALAVRSQNAQFAAGSVGTAPIDGLADVLWQVLPPKRFDTPEEFGEIIIRSSADGNSLKLKDVARIELNNEFFGVNARYNGKMASNMGIFLSPDGNALATADAVKAKLDEISKNFPPDLSYAVVFDTSTFVSISIKEVVKTLLEAMVLVFFIVFIFLQSWRATLIPAIAVPVSIIGTFAGMYILGFSINTLTMFAMVLSIGMVVDDAIIVVENVERLMSMGLSVRKATAEAMNEVTRPVIAVVLVLCSVFIPVSFLGGVAGVMYRQFAITIVLSVVISGIVALTFTPALCMLLLKKNHGSQMLPVRLFNRGFDYMKSSYLTGVRFFLKNSFISFIIYALTIGGIVFLLKDIPQSLVPDEDQGVIMAMVMLPDGTAADRTNAYSQKLATTMVKNKYVKGVMEISGFDMLGSTVRSNMGVIFFDLIPWSERTEPGSSVSDIIQEIQKVGFMMPEGLAFAFSPPSIPGMGAVGGFEMWVQNRGSGDVNQLYSYVMQIIGKAQSQPELAQVRTTTTISAPQLQLEVDRNKALAMGVAVSDIFSLLAATFGQSYVNDFNLFNRSYRVYAQADAEYRSTPNDLDKVYVRNNKGGMVPLGSLIKFTEISGPSSVERFNNFPAIKITGQPAPGYSSVTALETIEKLAYEILPTDYTVAWSGQAFFEKTSTSSAAEVLLVAMVIIFLILAAQYESWSLPFAVIVSVPFAILGAALAVYFFGYSNDIYFQVAIVTLVGLAAKNAILIIEFAVERFKKGDISLEDASLVGAELRFRPIIMTSLAFIFGTIPLALSSGAGAASRNVLGTAVVSGMLFATFLLPLFVPLFFRVIMKISLALFPPRDDEDK